MISLELYFPWEGYSVLVYSRTCPISRNRKLPQIHLSRSRTWNNTNTRDFFDITFIYKSWITQSRFAIKWYTKKRINGSFFIYTHTIYIHLSTSFLMFFRGLWSACNGTTFPRSVINAHKYWWVWILAQHTK